MNRDYIYVVKPDPMPQQVDELRLLNDEFWLNHIFYHVLSFYKTYDQGKFKTLLTAERTKQYPRIERAIARFLRKSLNNNRALANSGLIIKGEPTNDEEVEGYYDITINHSYWKKEFCFECKRLNETTVLINEYVFVNTNSKIDGGVYRYFNGKYSLSQNFGGMIGFILDGDMKIIKSKILEKLKSQFDISPEGDLLLVRDRSIIGNDFTFTSVHTRKKKKFEIYHILMCLG